MMKWSALLCAFALLGLAQKVGAGETAPRMTLPVFADAAQVERFCQHGLDKLQRTIAAFATQPLAEAASPTTMPRWDELDIVGDDLGGPLGIVSATAPDKPVRKAADDCRLKLAALQTQLYQNGEVYARLRSATPDTPAAKRLQLLTLEGFEDSGVSLPTEKRARAKAIFDSISALGVEFKHNTSENLGTVTMSVAELEGMPLSYRESHPVNADGLIELKMNTPDFVPFMENAISPEARRRYYTAFNRMGGERNLAILNEAAQLRKELAGLFGKPSFAHHIIARRMAGSPENVLRFLDSVQAKVAEAELRDLAILRQAKADFLGRPVAETKFERWDTAFYTERVRRARFNVDQDALRRYFPTQASIAWLMDLAQRLFAVRFIPAEVPVWHPDVRYFDIVDATGQRIAGAYFDLYPREGKYNHAAVWPVRGVSTRIGRQPISVLVTNMNRTGLDHGELETLLHEFGHLLHGTLSRTEFSSMAGTSVRRDFVEVPSQMLEEWARHTEPMALIRTHCTDCPMVDADLLRRINQARRFGAGIHYSRQHVLATFDMAMAGPQPGDALATYSALEKASALGHTPGTMFPARFGHLLGGYAAGYYGYMWSEVIALDMASQWQGKLMDPNVSLRYRDLVLARGGETPAEQIVREFLGREPSPTAFFAEITGSRHE
jgi:thimet oligopeptidase